jgi:outer membrane receptor protein involved in Fe transport
MFQRTVTKAALIAFACTASLAVNAYAIDRKPVEIPPGDLATALRMLATQAGVEFFYQTELVKGLHTDGVTGVLSAEEAVTKLLEGTSLTLQVDSSGAILIARPPASPPGTRMAPSAEVSDFSSKVELANQSTGIAGQSQKGSFWDRFRVAAADVAATGGNESAEGTTLDEIVVTAEKREERLVDVPLSISVMTADDINRLGATQFRDFANTIPGLSFQTAGPGYTQISLRGVSVGQDISPTVAIYVDEVPFGSTTTFARGGQITLDSGLFDVARLEVLRGPQGTLYGASTVGGLIKYVTKQPDAAKFGGETRVGLASTHSGSLSHDIAAAVNIPFAADKAALRVSGFKSHDGGYIDNIALGKDDVNESDIYGGRLDFLMTPNEKLSLRVTGFLQNTSTDGLPTADFTQAASPVAGELEQRRLVDESFDQRFRLVSGTVNYDLGWGSLTSISSYQTVRSRLFVDGSVLYLPTLPAGIPAATLGNNGYATTDKFTQEVRITSQGTDVLEWVVGGFYTDEDSSLFAGYSLRDAAGQELPNTVYTFLSPSAYKEYAAFGDVTWRLSEKFDVTGGLRYAKNRQSFEQTGTGTFGLSAPETRSNDHVVTYLANARYHFNDQATGYLRYATGYRPGGPNVLVLDPVTGERLGSPTFRCGQPEELRARIQGGRRCAGTRGGRVPGRLGRYSDQRGAAGIRYEGQCTRRGTSARR